MVKNKAEKIEISCNGCGKTIETIKAEDVGEEVKSTHYCDLCNNEMSDLSKKLVGRSKHWRAMRSLSRR